MTVDELIEKLENVPGDAKVYSEGCDCIEIAVDVQYDELDNTVLVARHRRDRK